MLSQTHGLHVFGEAKHEEKDVNLACHFLWREPFSAKLQEWLCFFRSAVEYTEWYFGVEEMLAHAEAHDASADPSNLH